MTHDFKKAEEYWKDYIAGRGWMDDKTREDVEAFDAAVLTALQIAQSKAEVEVVTERDYLLGYIETINKVGIKDDCAVYGFLMDTNRRHTKYMMERFPNGVKITGGEK